MVAVGTGFLSCSSNRRRNISSIEIMLEINYYFITCSSDYTGGLLVIYASVASDYWGDRSENSNQIHIDFYHRPLAGWICTHE